MLVCIGLQSSEGYLRYVQIHGLVAFPVRAVLHKAGIAPFDLDAASSFLLDMLYVSSTVAHDLCSQVEALDWLKVDRNTFFGPFTTSKFVSLDLLRFSTSESSLIDEVG